MTLGFAIFLAGALLVYAGITDLSLRALLTGDSTKKVVPAERTG